MHQPALLTKRGPAYSVPVQTALNRMAAVIPSPRDILGQQKEHLFCTQNCVPYAKQKWIPKCFSYLGPAESKLCLSVVRNNVHVLFENRVCFESYPIPFIILN